MLIFAFVVCALGIVSKRSLPTDTNELLPVFSSSFIVVGLIFRILIHVEFIFVSGVREGYNIVVLNVFFQFSERHVSRRLSCPYWVFMAPLLNIS